MESYEDFFSNARLYTTVHARPTGAQMKYIEAQKQAHQTAAGGEEQKMEDV